jgi:AcrR family transcriptional regulator
MVTRYFANKESLFAAAAEFALRLPDREAAATRPGLIATQTLGLALCLCVLKLPPVLGLQRAELVRRVGATVQAYLFDA